MLFFRIAKTAALLQSGCLICAVLIKDMVSHQKVGLPVCAGQDVGTGDTHLPCAGAGIHHLPAAQIDTYMTGRHAAALEHQHISLLGLAHAVKASVFGAAAPGDGGHVPLLHTCLIQAPVYKAGAVELVGSLGAPDIGAAHLGLCDLYEFIQLGGAGRGRFGRFGGLEGRKSYLSSKSL